MKQRKLICAALSALLILAGTAGVSRGEGTEPEESLPSLSWFEEKGTALGQCSLTYPALREGAADEELRGEINARILEDGGIRTYAERISMLISGGSLTVSWRGAVLGPVFSFGVLAEGAVSSLRPDSVRTGGNIDLRDGHEVEIGELFTDEDAAREAMEAYLEDEVAPDLSAYLQNSRVTPLPDRFRMTEQGLVWMYPLEQLSTLRDRAGEILIPWNRLREALDLSEGGLPSLMGVTEWLTGDGELPEEAKQGTAARIREAVEAGRIPGVPAALGDSVQELTDAWSLLIDPDVYVHGRFFALEGAEFRNVFLMTDFLTESWDHSVVDGIRMDQGTLFGLTVGETPREAWLALLGEPDHTIEMDGETAEAYRTVPGPRDYYAFEQHRLQLQADEEGMLVSIILSE